MDEQRCDICLDPSCEGRRDCHCNTCCKKATCHRVLRPTVRITTACTQQCGHCCFECGPGRTDFMAPEVAEKIAQFAVANGVVSFNVMGGEFFLHPEWEQILHTLASAVPIVRLVSNGDWAGIPPVAKRVLLFLRTHPNVRVALSKDQWHTNINTKKAAAILKRYKIPHNVAGEGDMPEEGVVPVGRGEFIYSMYSMFGTYCSKPDHKYTFLIDEQGKIYKCVYGVWDYADVDVYLHGGFRERFQKFGQKFYGAFIGNCGYCVRAYQRALCEGRRKKT